MQELIVTRNLSYKYKTNSNQEVLALKDINLTIKQGEFIAIIGTNGSGKSTLAKHFNALLLPSAGECRICGYATTDEQNIWHIRQNVGMVFQNPDNQIVAALVEEDVAFGPENIGLPPAQIRQRVEYALNVVSMADYAKQAPHMLSGGQKQRVAIAGVLALQPICMVLDEPTAMLDPLGRQEVLTTVKSLNKEKAITVVLITHFMQEAALADRVIVMHQGEILKEGSPLEVFSQVEEIKSLGLEVPLAAEIAWKLRKKGVALPTLITDEELAQALCR